MRSCLIIILLLIIIGILLGVRWSDVFVVLCWVFGFILLIYFFIYLKKNL